MRKKSPFQNPVDQFKYITNRMNQLELMKLLMKPKLDLIGIPKKILKNLRIMRKRQKMLRMKSWSTQKRKMKRKKK